MTPEEIHLALSHVPILGAAFALVPLAIGLIFRNRGCLLAGLLIAALSGWTTGLVMGSGEDAGERYTEGEVRPFLDAGVAAAVEQHDERAHTGSKVLYLVAALATAAVLVMRIAPKWERLAAGIVLVTCLAAFLVGLWIADSGGEIRRPDLRGAPIGEIVD